MYELIALGAVSRRAFAIREAEREELANMITDKIVEAWNRGQK